MVIEKINAALRTALRDPELIKRQEALGITVVKPMGGLLRRSTRSSSRARSINRWMKTINDAGVQPESATEFVVVLSSSATVQSHCTKTCLMFIGRSS
jgi:hypothetical protein